MDHAPTATMTDTSADQGQRLRLLSYNIQAGIATPSFRHYLTGSWKHLIPHPKREQTLQRIATLLHDFDIVGLQEADAGSLRTGDINLTEYLAHSARFPYWSDQTNRNIGRFAQHSIGLLSRYRPRCVEGHRLPGPPGRGALCAHFEAGEQELVLIILHLALGRRARGLQLDYLREQTAMYPHLIVMGDLNLRAESEQMSDLIRTTSLRPPQPDLATFPSWNPRRSIDHILVSETLYVAGTRVLPHAVSDHLPLCMDVSLPPSVRLTAG